MNSVAICKGLEKCNDCFLKKNGICRGCDEEYYNRCLKRVCKLNCDSCSGGLHQPVFGFCQKNIYLKNGWYKAIEWLMNVNVGEINSKDIKIKSKLIPVISTQIRKYNIPDCFPEIDAWAVNITRVLNRTKMTFYSKDLKEYLGLPNDRKLILTTCAPDIFQEFLWKNGSKINFRSYNIDYWFPGHYSIYDNDSKMYQLSSAKRQQISAKLLNSQFVWFRLGENISLDFLKIVRNEHNILISTQQQFSKKNRLILEREIKLADKWFPKKCSFFIVGTFNLIPKLNRKLYNINSRWLYCTLAGRNMKDEKLSNLSKHELAKVNLNELLYNINY